MKSFKFTSLCFSLQNSTISKNKKRPNDQQFTSAAASVAAHVRLLWLKTKVKHKFFVKLNCLHVYNTD